MSAKWLELIRIISKNSTCSSRLLGEKGFFYFTNELQLRFFSERASSMRLNQGYSEGLDSRASQNFQGLNFQTPPRSLAKNMNVH